MIDLVIQARLSSSRLPGKVLNPFADNRSILDLQVEGVSSLDVRVILATTTSPVDDPLAKFAQDKNILLFRGSESDVLSRFIKASETDYIIRVCADNPFLNANAIQNLIAAVEEGVDYISFCNTTGVPAIKTHWGLFAEVASRSALLKAYEVTKTLEQGDFYREHVTNFLYEHPEKFTVKLLTAPEIIKDRNDLRFTIDTPEDFANMQQLYQYLQQQAWDKSLTQLIKVSDDHHAIKSEMMKGIQKFTK